MATIYDVAKAANVSIAAVSLVMNNSKTPRVGAPKRKLILEAATKLGYAPSGLARALSRGSTKILGLVVPMRDPIFFNNFIAGVLAGIQSCVIEHGYHLMIYTHSAKNGRITKGELTQSRFVDGVVMLNTRLCSLEDMKNSIDDLREAAIPFVMTNCYAGDDKINYVGVDDTEVGYRGANFLLERGYSRIALLSGSSKSPMTPALLSGFKDALTKAGKRFDLRLHAVSDYNPATIHDKIAVWCALPHPPTAIFCADDQLVPDVYRTLEELNLRIPADMAILGRGNLPIGDVLKPPLTTFAVQPVEIGRKAAELLIEVVQTHTAKVRRIYLDAPLILRESVQDSKPA
ncbi:MAG: LacI family DNA-binding transcriptional regulator [Terracidiphilus sp.]|nr:LacI family DNA-binding transcriptional regulator [Terracidiphilus sp.]